MAGFFSIVVVPSELMLSLFCNEVIDNYHLLCDNNNAAIQEKWSLLARAIPLQIQQLVHFTNTDHIRFSLDMYAYFSSNAICQSSE